MLLPLIINNLGMGTHLFAGPSLNLSMGGGTIALTMLDSSLDLVSEGTGIASVAVPDGLLTLSLSAKGANATASNITWETAGVMTLRYVDLTASANIDTANSPMGTSWGPVATTGLTASNFYELWYRLALSDFHPDWDDTLWRDTGITWQQPGPADPPFEDEV